MRYTLALKGLPCQIYIYIWDIYIYTYTPYTAGNHWGLLDVFKRLQVDPVCIRLGSRQVAV